MKARVPFIPQMESVECGAASLTMVLACHGHHAPLAEVRRACGVNRDGASAAGILKAAREYGLEGTAYRADLDQLHLLSLPAILHWDFSHFLVLERWNGAKAGLVDPGSGRRTVGLEDLRRSYTGVAIELEPTSGFRKRSRQRPALQRYLALAWANLPALTQVLVLSVALQAIALMLPAGQKVLVDHILVPEHTSWLWILALTMAGALMAHALLSFTRGWVVQNLQLAMDLHLTDTFIGHLLRLPLGFFLQRRHGDLIQRIDSNGEVQALFTQKSVAALLDMLLLAGFATLMVCYSLRLGLLILGLGLVRVATQWAVSRVQNQLMSVELAATGGAYAVLAETLGALETIKAAGTGGVFVRRWADAETASLNAGLRRQFLNLKLSALMSLLSDLGACSVLFLAGWEVLHGRMSMGTFAAFLMIQNLFLVPLGSLLDASGKLQLLGSHLRRLDDVMGSRPEHAGTLDPSPLRGGIALVGVGFSYPGAGNEAVADLDLLVKPGQMVALVGPSGAGKSTVARLLLGMHRPSRGRISFDGRDLADLDLTRLRRGMGVVLQETFLLNDTVAANLAFNRPGLPLARLVEAAERACIHEVIAALPMGYQTVIGENGARLSGGERQRLALARALAPGPSILLLDEATSALDAETEARVHARLAGLACTRIVIAHRLATIREADRVLVVNHGRIVQSGTFRELADQPGLFRDMAGNP